MTRLYAVDPRFGESWTQAVAYVLGYALADGNVNRNLTSLVFTSIDIDQLETVRSLMGSNHPIVRRNDSRVYVNAKPCFRLQINSVALIRRLFDKGLTPAKSYIGGYPEIPHGFWPHLFRGILDGDGNICLPKNGGLRITIAGNSNVVMGLQRDAAGFGIKAFVKYLSQDRCKLFLVYGENAQKLLNIVYTDSEGMRLERKYSIWRHWQHITPAIADCRLCGVEINGRNNRKLCNGCQKIRQRLFNRRADHYRRTGILKPLKELVRPGETELAVESIDKYFAM